MNAPCKMATSRRLKRLAAGVFTLAIAACCFTSSSVSEVLHPADAMDTATQPQGRRGLRQVQTSGWKVIQVLDFGGFYDAALEANDENARIRIIVQNHIVANSMALNTIINGHLWISGNCSNIPKIPSKSHAYMLDVYNVSPDGMCQFFLNQLSSASPRFSFNASQARTQMSGLPFFAVSATGRLMIEDAEIGGCYAISGGACVNLAGGQLSTMRTAFTAAYSADSGGAIYASLGEGGRVWPKVDIQYTVFTDNQALLGGNDLYFAGDPTSLTALPDDMDKSGWEISFNVPSAPPSPPVPPPSPPPPPSPLAPAPPPPVPGNYQEFQGEVADERSGSVLEDLGLAMYIGGGVGAMVFLCCISVMICHILITFKLCCFKNAKNDSIAGKVIKRHSMFIEPSSFKRGRGEGLQSLRAGMSFKLGRKGGLVDEEDDIDYEYDKFKSLKEKKNMLMGKSTRNLRQALDTVTSLTQSAATDNLDYKADAKARGAHVGAFKKPVVLDVHATSGSAVPESESLPKGTEAIPRPKDLPAITSYWGPPSLGAVYASLPKADRHAGPLDQRSKKREASGNKQGRGHQ